MTPETLCQIGELLYGPWWHGEMAKRLGFSRKHVSRMSLGHSRIKDSVAAQVIDIMAAHATELLVLTERAKAKERG